MKHLPCAVFAACLSTTVFAGTMGTMLAYDPWMRVITLSGGPAWTSSGETQAFLLQDDLAKTYAATSSTHVLASGELFLGLQHRLNPTFSGQIGLALAGATNANIDGDIWEDSDPDFNNYFYNYKVNHAHVAVKGKLLADFWPLVQPYVSGSIGVGFNHAHDFSITPKIFEEVPAPGFTDHTTSALTYTLGVGVQKAISTHWQAGVGYEFANWGKSELNRAPGQTLGSGLHLSHLYTHQLQFSLSYLA